MTNDRVCLLLLAFLMLPSACRSQTRSQSYDKGRLLYENSWSTHETVKDWVMEGPGELRFADGWMQMYAENEKWHHVLWCPVEFPSQFIAEWQIQNLHVEAGLLIVFFAAQGTNGEDIFDPALPPRDGAFRFYTKDKLNSYHISYYANNPKNPGRELSHLRKNNMFALVQTGAEGIAKHSEAIHTLRLVKDDGHILFFVDGRKIIDWEDDGETYGPLYRDGKFGLRQMQWSHFRYRNFKVWSIKNN